MTFLSKHLPKFSAWAVSLFEGATSPTDRRDIGTSHADSIHKQIGGADWKKLVSVGNYLYANMGELRGAINERARLAVGAAWQPQCTTSNRVWNNQAESFLLNWREIGDVKGPPFTLTQNLKIASKYIDHSGDCGMILTEFEGGYPAVQFIPAHAIGSRILSNTSVIADGPYRGLRYHNGVILNRQSRPVAYNIRSEIEGEPEVIISARDMLMLFNPDWFDQGRGIPSVACGLPSWQDSKETTDFEKLAVKVASAHTLVEWNEKGESDDGASHINSGEKVTSETTKPVNESFFGGLVRYLRAGSGAKLQMFESNRPSPAWQGFMTHLKKNGFDGMDWPAEFVMLGTLKSPEVRLVIQKARRSIIERQKILLHAFKRADDYAIAKAMKLGILPWNDEWFMRDYQMPEDITIDVGNEGDKEREDYKLGFTTLKRIAGRREEYWEDVVDQRGNEAEYFIDKAQDIATRKQIPFDLALRMLRQDTPNPAAIEPEKKQAEETQTETE